jgi:hypothetical protein
MLSTILQNNRKYILNEGYCNLDPDIKIANTSIEAILGLNPQFSLEIQRVLLNLARSCYEVRLALIQGEPAIEPIENQKQVALGQLLALSYFINMSNCQIKELDNLLNTLAKSASVKGAINTMTQLNNTKLS